MKEEKNNLLSEFVFMIKVFLILLLFYVGISFLGGQFSILGLKIFIPFFEAITSKINFYFIVVLFVVLQVSIIFLYFRLGKFVYNTFIYVKANFKKWNFDLVKKLVSY